MSFADDLRNNYKSPEDIAETNYLNMVKKAANDAVGIIRGACNSANNNGTRICKVQFVLTHEDYSVDGDGDIDSFNNPDVIKVNRTYWAHPNCSNDVTNKELCDVLELIKKEISNMGFDSYKINEVEKEVVQNFVTTKKNIFGKSKRVREDVSRKFKMIDVEVSW